MMNWIDIIFNFRRILNSFFVSVQTKLLGQMLYYVLTTGSGQQTLGEEYCDINQVNKHLIHVISSWQVHFCWFLCMFTLVSCYCWVCFLVFFCCFKCLKLFFRFLDLMDFLQIQQDVLFSSYTRQQSHTLLEELGSLSKMLLVFSCNYVWL